MNRQSGGAGIYNGLSIFFLVLTFGVIVFVILQLATPVEEEERPLSLIPTPLELPTLTPIPPSETPRPTLPPTFTNTPPPSETPTNTPPPTSTLAPSATITNTPGPTLTPSDTPTPSISPTPEPSNTPIGPTNTLPPTQSPFLFGLRNQVIFNQNTVNNAGCAWQGIGGSVLDQTGIEITNRQFQVRVFGNGIERVVTTGSNTIYGSFTGWEVTVSNIIEPKTYFARLESLAGTPISPDIQVTFPGDCLTNAAIVTFIQTRDF